MSKRSSPPPPELVVLKFRVTATMAKRLEALRSREEFPRLGDAARFAAGQGLKAMGV